MNSFLTSADVVQATGGKELGVLDPAGTAKPFSRLSTDSRENLTGGLFVALRGDKYDAHDFLSKALSGGASGVLVDRLPSGFSIPAGVSAVMVKDTRRALQDLGRYWRKKMPAKILALTGTNGKTTTKEFAAALIGSQKKVVYSKGSLNNHWGVPLSLLAIRKEHEFAIIEMGMNHPGEIRELLNIAEPDVALVTMVGRGHLEGVGSIEGVAAAKKEMYQYSAQAQLAIFNLANEWTRKMWQEEKQRTPARAQLTFGTAESDIFLEVEAADEKSLSLRGAIQGVAGQAIVQVFGAHNVTNLMAAAALSLAAGLSPQQIWQALPLCQTGWGRNQWVMTKAGARVLFDAYNANPESMRAAIENFAKLSVPQGTRKIAVLGEMREMGAAAPQVHREIGELVGRSGVDYIVFVGSSKADFEAGVKAVGFNKSLFVTDSYETNLASRFLPVLDHTDIVVMKGSRGVQLERLLAEWQPIDFQLK